MYVTLSASKKIFQVVRFSASHFDLKKYSYMKSNYGFHGTATGVPVFRETATGILGFRGTAPGVPEFGAPPRWVRP
jgi:hypothetical protein